MRGDPRPGHRPIADGGTDAPELFGSFPDPLLAYGGGNRSDRSDESDGRADAEGEFVVRRVNPAFEAAFDIGAGDLTGTPLDEVALAGGVRPGPEGQDPTGGTAVRGSGASGDPDDPEDHDAPDGSEGPGTVVSSPAPTVGSLLERVRDVGSGVRFDWRGGGETRHFRVRTVDPGPPDGTGYLVFTDITGPERERRALEGRVEHLERVASVARHDLRNPLEVARIRLEAARDTGEDVHFEKIAGALDRIEGIARKVLAAGGGSLDPTDAVALGAVAEAAWETVDTADAALVTSPGLPTVRGDADQLRGLFENLFRNAVEHGSTSSRPESDDSVEHGSTTPRSQAREDSAEQSSAGSRTQSGDSVEHGSTCSRSGSDDPVEHGGRDVTVTVEPLPDGFAVADDGPGIPEDVRERAFEAGFSTAPDNSGLGLSIVRRIAREHGWRVSLASGGESAADADGGARFEFTGVERVEDGDEPGRPGGSDR